MDFTGTVDYGAALENYTWNQTRGEVTCQITKDQLCKALGLDAAATNLRARDLQVELTLTTVKVGIKGKGLMLDGTFPNRINTDDSTWTWDSETGILELTLSKDQTVHDSDKPWWPSFVNGEPEIDVDLIEGSKYLDVSLLKKVKAAKAERKAEEAKKAGGGEEEKKE